MAKSRGKAGKRKSLFNRGSANLIFVAAIIILVGATLYLNRLTNAVEVTPTLARPAQQFVDSVGVNIDATPAGATINGVTLTAQQVFDTIIKKRLQELNIYNIRTTMAPASTDDQGFLTSLRNLNAIANPASGPSIKPMFLVTKGTDSNSPGNSCFLPKLKAYMKGGSIPCGPAGLKDIYYASDIDIDMIDQSNEPDHLFTYKPNYDPNKSWYENINADNPDWRSATLSTAAALKSVLASDTVTSGIKIVGPSYVHLGASENPTYKNIVVDSATGKTLFQEQTVVADSVDYGNVHPYCGNSQLSCYNTDVPPWIEFYKNKPLVATEWGFSTVNTYSKFSGTEGYSETKQAKYVLRGLFDYFDKGIKRNYVYELRDRGPDGASLKEANFGLVKYDGTPKKAFSALSRTLRLLDDPGANFNPTTLSYGISGETSTIKHTLLQKRDGSFYLVLRHEKASSNDTDETKNVTVNFGEAVTTAELYSPHVSSTATATFSDPLSINLSIPDKVVVLRIITPSAAPSISPTPTPTEEPTPTPTPTATASPAPGLPMHAGNINVSSATTRANKFKASASITVHDENEQPVAGVRVSGSWSTGEVLSVSCTTDENGQCTVQSSEIPSKKSVIYTITGMSKSGYSYKSSANHDPDGESSGTKTLSITAKTR